MPTEYADAIEIFEKNSGTLRSGQARQYGINPATLASMYREGLLVKETRGVYRLATETPWVHPDLTTVAIRVPRAVICLISALAFHHLTTHIPNQTYVALPRDHKAPRLDWPPTTYVWLREPAYSAGIETHTIDGVPVKIYSAEKTVADCFKFRNKLGRRVAVEALKDYLSQPNFAMDQLLRYAETDRVATVMLPYIRALTA